MILKSEVAQAFCVHLSTTWSACASTDCGIVRPMALAALTVDDQFELRGLLDGRSPGFVPLENPVHVGSGVERAG